MELLLSTIVLWLSVNFSLAPINDHPAIEFVTTEEITNLRHGHEVALAGDDKERSAYYPSVVAVYNTQTKTIYLPTGWTGRTPAETSILVHEMVHHLLTLSGAKFACPEEGERLAYAAQEKWLGLMGTSLKNEFDLDQMTLKVLTNCFY